MPASTSAARRLRLGVGIDTARYGHHVTFLGDDLQRAAPDLPVPESRVGYQRLELQLRRLCERHPDAELHVRIDAAGQYAANLEHFLRSLDLPLPSPSASPNATRITTTPIRPSGRTTRQKVGPWPATPCWNGRHRHEKHRRSSPYYAALPRDWKPRSGRPLGSPISCTNSSRPSSPNWPTWPATSHRKN